MPMAPAVAARAGLRDREARDVGEVQDGHRGPQPAADAVGQGDSEHSASVAPSGMRLDHAVPLPSLTVGGLTRWVPV
jgi:hypothetical protein